MSRAMRVPPEEDFQLASQRRLTFYVGEKMKRGSPWLEILRTTDLTEALTRAQQIVNDEAGVLVETRHGGFIYWTSLHPDVFNSTVLQHDYS